MIATSALRNDDIGALARRLIGTDEVPPDLTAAVPLSEALQANGLDRWAGCLESCVSSLSFQAVRDGQQIIDHQPRQRGDTLGPFARFVQNRLQDDLGFLTLDFASAAGALAALLEASLPTAARPPETSQVAVEAVTVDVPAPIRRVGRVWTLEDGRQGIVIAVLDDGRVRVLPTGDEEFGESPPGMMGYPRPTRRVR